MSRQNDCPGCGHGENRHVGYQCYGPVQLVPVFIYGKPKLFHAVGGCMCNWSYQKTKEWVGWRPPEGTKSRYGGHLRGKARREYHRRKKVAKNATA